MDYCVKVINEDWKFILKDEAEAFQKDFPDNDWQQVRLPHDWSVHYPLSREYSSGTGYVRGGTAWYRKHFYLPKELEDSRVFLRFDGIYKNSQVWINSYYLGKRPYGYTTFQYDISDFLCCGETENVISVRVSREDLADSRWFTGSGITRKVSLLIYNQVYPAEYGIFFYNNRVTEEEAELTVTNELFAVKPMDVTVHNRLYDADNNLVLELTGKASLGEEASKIETKGILNNPKLWSPDEPNLYTLETAVVDTETKKEYLIDRQKVGIRTFEFDPEQGFFLNGKREVFKGVCLHHDAGTLGAAVTKEIWRRRLIKLKKMGCNAIRMSHNPHMPELYELCDEMGFLVMDEAFDEWEAPKNKWHIGHNVYPPKHYGYAEDFPHWYEQDLSAMVKRGRNHPSIVMWSIGNEIDYPNDPYNHPSFDMMTGNNDHNKPMSQRRYNPNRPNSERLVPIAKELVEIVKQHDHTEPVTQGLAFPELSTRIGFGELLDVLGYNYKEHLYAEDHQRFPDKPLLGSENRHEYAAWRAVVDNQFISGQFLWTGIDYLGECRGWPHHGAYFGLLTTAGFEKPDYYRRQSWWADEPVIRLVTARKGPGEFEPREFKPMYESWNYVPGEEIEVRCYTNQENVKLYLNGELCENQVDTAELGYLTWIVPFQPGVLEAEAGEIGYKLETVNAPVQIKLVPDYQVGDDILQIELYVLDDQNRRAVSDRSLIRVRLEGEGELLALDNGDLADVTDFTAPYRHAYDGRMMIYVRKTGSGVLKVTAESPYLKSDTLEID